MLYEKATEPVFADLSVPVLSAIQFSPKQADLDEIRVRSSVLKTYSPGYVDIFLLGISIAISGQSGVWNQGISAGLASCSVACVLMGSAYIVLCSCLAEITGALPFAGGSYGLTRCTLGFYLGFLIGCCEAVEYIVCVALAVISAGQILTDLVPSFDGMQPLIWLGFYCMAVVVHIRGDRMFWVSNAVLGVVSLLIVLVFCFGSLPSVDFGKYAVDDTLTRANSGFVGGFEGFMKALPLLTWCFIGIETVNLASDQVERPTAIIPKAQMAGVVTLFITLVFVFVVAISLPPGLSALPSEFMIFNRGFMPMFGISSSAAAVLSVPSTFGCVFVYIWCYSKLISAMATSRLLPPVLSTKSRYDTPYVAILFGSTVSYLMTVVIYYGGLGDHMFMSCMACACLTYIAQCISYILLRRNYQDMANSSYRSPFGIIGAVYAICVWVLTLVAIGGYQGNDGSDIITIIVIAVLLTIFYFAYSRKRQVLSPQEKRVLLVARDLV